MTRVLYTAEAEVTDRSFVIGVELHLALPGVPEAEAVQLVRAAHRVCPYSHATCGNVEIVLTANGAPVEV